MGLHNNNIFVNSLSKYIVCVYYNDMMYINSQRLLSRLDMQGEARKKYTTFFLNNQRNSNRQNSSKQHTKQGITGP